MTKPHETPGLLLIISGPSGVGKTTITRALEHELEAVFSVSMTTRPKADGDIEGLDYHFVDQAEFDRQREAGQLLEWARVFEHCYGTPRGPVERNLAAGRVMILEIDVQGAIQIKRNMPGALALFILPPSEPVLLERLRSRKRESEPAIQHRFTQAKAEIARARESGIYDGFVLNEDLERAVADALVRVRTEVGSRE